MKEHESLYQIPFTVEFICVTTGSNCDPQIKTAEKSEKVSPPPPQIHIILMLNLGPDLSLLLFGLFSACLPDHSCLFPLFFCPTDSFSAESRYQGKVLCRSPAEILGRILSSIYSQHAPGQLPCLPLHLVLKMKFCQGSLKRFDKSQSFYLWWVCGFDVIASGQPMTGLNI